MKKYLFLLLLASLYACGNKPEKTEVVQATAAAPAAETTTYELATVEARAVETAVNLPGELKPFEIVHIFPKVNGFVKEVLVDRGTEVRKGQVLLRLESPEIEQQVLAAKSKYLQAYTIYLSDKDRYDRLKMSAKTPGAVAAIDIESARNKMLADSALMESEQATRRSLEAIRGYLTVIAPFDGRITERNIHSGALVGPSTRQEDKAMLVLEQEKRLRLVLSVPEVYSSQVAKNLPVSFKVNALPGELFKGKIDRLTGSLNMKFRSETIEIDVYNGNGRLKPGMYAEVVLMPQRKAPALVIPRAAIVTSMERKYVVKVLDGKMQLVDVMEGTIEGDFVEVFGKLASGDQLILNPNDEMQDGMSFEGK